MNAPGLLALKKPMNEPMAFQLLYGFLGFVAFGVVLLVLQLTLKNTNKVKKWQQFADQKGWTLLHRATQNPQWQLTCPEWKVWFDEPLREDLPSRLVFQAVNPAVDFHLLLIGQERWTRLVEGTSPASQESRLEEQGLEDLKDLIHSFKKVQVATPIGGLVVHSNQPERAQHLLETPQVQLLLRQLPGKKLPQDLHLLLGTQIRLQVNGLEWEEAEVLALIEAGRALLQILKGKPGKV